jgi:type II secretory ATPase GspE/PulE/Tfp pilus assembly ATPase PilB-like protein
VKCKQPVAAASERAGLILRAVSPAARALLSQATIYEPAGCPACGGSGYRGRTGIFEVLRVTDAIEDLIIKRASVPLIRAQAKAEGMRSLRDAGLRKVALGETSIAEVLEHTVADSEEPVLPSEEITHHA